MLKCGKCKFLYYVRTSMKYVTKSTDKLNIARFTSCIGLKYHKIRYKSRGNNPIKPFQVQFTCVRPVFLLVTSSVFWKCASKERSHCQRRRELFLPRYCSLERRNER